MLDAAAGTQVAPAVAEACGRALHERTQGNPFFTHELLQALHERGGFSEASDEWNPQTLDDLELPESVRSVIRQRLAHLAAETQEALQEASVLGQVFAFGDLQAMGGRSEMEVEAACSAALVREGGGEAYGFAHALVHEALYREVPARKRRRHPAAGKAIERMPERRRQGGAAELVHQYLEAVYAHAEREQHFRSALDLARELGDQAREAEAMEKLGQVLGYQSRPADALDTFERAAQAYQSLGDFECELRVLAALAWALQGHTIEQAEAALARILPRLASREREVTRAGRASPGLALATLHVVVLYWTASRLYDALACVDRGSAPRARDG
jgi:predicted ATPase